jgi:hypothetical protein
MEVSMDLILKMEQ